MKRLALVVATLSLLFLAACAGPVGGGIDGGSSTDGGTADGGTDGGSSDGGTGGDCGERNFGTVSDTALEIPGVSLAGVATPTCTYIDAYETSMSATVLWISDGDLSAVYESIKQALGAGEGWALLTDEFVNENYRQVAYYAAGSDGASLSTDVSLTAGIDATDAEFFAAPEGGDVVMVSYSSLEE